MKHAIATLTNIFYGLAGLAIYQHDITLWPVSVALIILMLGSGYHHYHLKGWSRWTDFVGMYMALSVIALAPFFNGIVLLALSIAWAAGLYLIFNSKVEIILALIGVVLVILLYAVGWQVSALLEVSAWAAIAMVFNYAGDNVHQDHHEIYHSLGWHIPTAYALYLVTTMMV